MKKKYFVFAVVLLILYFLGVTQYIADSEFWPITLSKEVGSFGTINFALYYKFFFHALLRIPYFFELSNSGHILFVKNMMATVGIGIIVSFYCICQRLFKSEFVSCSLCFILLTTQAFFSQYSRVRSDLLICLIFLISFLHILRIAEKKKFSSVDFAIQSFLVIIAFFCSPKAIYWMIMNFGVLYIYLGFMQNRFRAILMCLGTHFLFLSLLLCLSLWLQSGLFENIKLSLIAAFDYFVHSNLSHFIYVTRMAEFDLFFILLTFVALFLLIRKVAKKKSLQQNEKACLYFGLVSITALFVHNQRLPFFIASLLPFMTLMIGFLILEFQEEIRDRRILVSFLLLICLSKYNVLYAYGLYWHSNSTQLKKISQVEDRLRSIPHAVVFDGLGVLPRLKNIYVYIDPFTSRDRRDVIAEIERGHPDVILYNNRSVLLEPYLGQELEANFKEVSVGVWVLRKYDLSVDTAASLPLRYYFTFEPSF